MHNIANKFALWIAKNGGSENEQEIYAYGIECLLNTILVFGVIVIIWAILNRLPITLI